MSEHQPAEVPAEVTADIEEMESVWATLFGDGRIAWHPEADQQLHPTVQAQAEQMLRQLSGAGSPAWAAWASSVLEPYLAQPEQAKALPSPLAFRGAVLTQLAAEQGAPEHGQEHQTLPVPINFFVEYDVCFEPEQWLELDDLDEQLGQATF